MTTPHTPPAALDVAAIEARAAQVAHALETAQETRVLLAHIAALQAQHAAAVTAWHVAGDALDTALGALVADATGRPCAWPVAP